MTLPKSETNAPFIAERHVHILEQWRNTVAVLSLGAPYLDAQSNNFDWACRIQVTLGDESHIDVAYGTDSVQALINAIFLLHSEARRIKAENNLDEEGIGEWWPRSPRPR